MALGIILKHEKLANQLYVVENPTHRFKDELGNIVEVNCNVCIGVKHKGKTTHLWLEPNGCCIVSEGVYKELQAAGMPGLSVTGSVDTPPPLKVGRKAERQEVDNENRKIYLPTGLEKPHGHQGRSGRSPASV